MPRRMPGDEKKRIGGSAWEEKRVGVSACRRIGVGRDDRRVGVSAWPRVWLVGTRSRALRRGTSINREHAHKNAGMRDKELRGVEPQRRFRCCALSYWLQLSSVRTFCGRAAPDAPECIYRRRRCTGRHRRTCCGGSRGSASLPATRAARRRHVSPPTPTRRYADPPIRLFPCHSCACTAFNSLSARV